jgi:hypothetical protein
MPMRTGTSDPERERLKAMLVVSARYAIRAATMRGEETDFDPDALIQNLIVGMLGYNTPNGLSNEDF